MNLRVRSAAALALGTATAAAAPPPVVRVFVAGTPDAVAGTRDALRDGCARPNLVIVVEDAAALGAQAETNGDGAAPDSASTWGDGDVPATNGDVPATNGDVPSTNGAAPSTNGAAPSTNGAVPSTNGAAPSTNGAAPSTNGAAPSTNGAVPPNEARALAAGHASDLAVGYVALEPAAESRVVLVDGHTHEELERRVLAPTESLEMSIETVAHVICATIDSTLAVRLPPAPAPRPAPRAPVPVAPSTPRRAPSEGPSTFGAWAGVFGTGADYGAGFRGGGGGMFGATTGSSRLRASLLALADDFPSVALDRQGARPSFGLFGARLLPGAALRAADDIEVFVGMGPGVDWLRVAAGTPPPDGTPEAGVSSVDPVLSGLLGARLRVGGHVGLWLGVAADLDAYRHRYVNASSGAPVVFFELPRLRGSGQAGLTVTFGRDGASTHRNLARAESGSSP